MVKKNDEEKKVCTQLYSSSDKTHYEINNNDIEITGIDPQTKTTYTVIGLNKKTNKIVKKKYSEEDFKKLCDLVDKMAKYKINS